ncbi:MAG TPA: hypothetical protein VNO81_00530 [Candidatus Nitrosotenuis sp.]|nr:hypothetical protein [Candidatus Nitrosotenuis sp.]
MRRFLALALLTWALALPAAAGPPPVKAFQSGDKITPGLRYALFDLGVALRYGLTAIDLAPEDKEAAAEAVEELRWLGEATGEDSFTRVASDLAAGKSSPEALRQRYIRSWDELNDRLEKKFGAEGIWYLRLGTASELLWKAVEFGDLQTAQKELATFKEMAAQAPRGLPPKVVKALESLARTTTVVKNDPNVLEPLFIIRYLFYQAE